MKEIWEVLSSQEIYITARTEEGRREEEFIKIQLTERFNREAGVWSQE